MAWDFFGEGDADNFSWSWDDYDPDVYDYSSDVEDPGFWGEMDAYGQQYSEAFMNGVDPDQVDDPTFWEKLGDAVPALLNKFGDAAKSAIFNNGDPSKGINATGLFGLIRGVNQAFGDRDINSAGWSTPVPKYTAYREMIQQDDAGRRPGAAGRRYFSDTYYAPQGDAEAGTLAAQYATQSAADRKSTYTPPAPPTQVKTVATTFNQPASEFRTATPSQALPRQAPVEPMKNIDQTTGGLAMAAGGMVPGFRGQLQEGGFVLPGDVVAHADPVGAANKNRGLQALNRSIGVESIRGPGDAMSDSIPTTIEGREPARVANGEAYVPRENVEKIGGGDMDKGADRLYDIMNHLRKKRTGSTKQINPDNPQELQRAYGGPIPSMASGGEVKRYNTSSLVTTDPETGASVTGYGSSSMNTLSPYLGEYVTNALGKGAALADMPYQAYQGPLTAGASGLQQQAFAGASDIASTGYTPTQFTGGLFDTAAAQQYMNPYLSTALDPQLKELARQSAIQQLQDRTALTKAGAFGGGRQAIMESEGRRNLLDKQQQALAEGYSSAYDKAMAQFNADQGRQMEAQKATESSRQYGAGFARQSLADLANLGTTQRDIEAEGIAADKAQFEEERDYAYRMPQYQLNLLSGLPVGGTSTTPNTTSASQFDARIADLESSLRASGVIS